MLSAGTSDIGLSFRGAGQREIQNGLSLDGISSSSNLLAMTSMRPISDAVTEVQVQTGSTSAEYGSYLGVHINVVTKSGTNDPAWRDGLLLPGTTRSTRAATSRTRPNPKNPRERNQFSFQADGPVVLPFYDGRNRTFFMGAYEGVRSQAQSHGIRHGADGADAAGQLLRGHDGDSGTRSPIQPFAGQHHSPDRCSRRRRSICSQYYPGAEPAGSGLQPPRDAHGDR